MKQKVLNLIYFVFAIFARIYLKRQKPKIIWITWSVGKTSCRMIVNQTLKKFLNQKIYTSPKNYNSEIWIVCSIFQIENYKPSIFYLFWLFFKIFFISIFGSKKYDILVLEYWVDKPKDMDFLLSIAKPDIAIFTKLDFIHVANFENQDELWLEKMKLIFWAKKIVYLNKKDNFQKNIFDKINKQKYFYNDENIDFSYIFEDNLIFSELNFDWKKIKTNLLWEENIVYFKLSLDILKNFKSNLSDFDERNILGFSIQKWRFSIFSWVCNSIIIDSSYNSGPESMKAMIKNAVALKNFVLNDYENLFVLWDMREIWEKSAEKHREIFDFASQFWEIISVWKETRQNFWNHLWNFKYAKDAWKFLREFLEQNKNKKYLILFKWSQNTIFLEEAIKEVLENENDKKSLVRQETYWNKTNF